MGNSIHSRFNVSSTLDDSSQRKTAKILSLQLQQMKAPKWNQNPPSFCYYCKEPGHWEKDCDKLEHWGALRPLTRLPRVLRVPGPALRSCRGSPPPPSFFSLLVQVLFRPQSLTARPLGNLSFFFFLINVVFSPTLFQSTQIGFWLFSSTVGIENFSLS